MVSKSLLERTRALASTQRRKQQEEIDDDVTPQDLLAAFDSCRKRDDGTVDARALAHWLQVDAGARNFAAHVQALKKPRFTRAEFEKLVNAYELRVANAVAQGKGDDAAARARIKKKKAAAKRGAPTGSGDNKDSDGEKGEDDDDDKEGSKTTANLSSTSGRMRMKARVEAKKQERLHRMRSGDEDDEEEEEDAEPKTPTSRNGGREMFEEVSLSDNEDHDGGGGKSARDAASLQPKQKGAPRSAPASSMFKLTQGLKLFKFSSPSSSGDLKKGAPVDAAAGPQPDTALRSPSPRGLSATAPASTQAVATAAVKQTSSKKGISFQGLKRSMSWTSSQQGGAEAAAAAAAAGTGTHQGGGRDVSGSGRADKGKRAGGKRPFLHFTNTTDPPSPATHTHTDSPSEPSTPTPLASTKAFSDFDAQQAAKPSPTKRFWSLTLSPGKLKKGGKETNKENTKAAANRLDTSQPQPPPQPPPLTPQQLQQLQQQLQQQQMQVQTQGVAQQPPPAQLEKLDRSQRALQKVITTFGKPKSAPPSLTAAANTSNHTAAANTSGNMATLALSLTQSAGGGSALGSTANLNFDSDDEDDGEEEEGEEEEGTVLAATRPATLDTSAAVAQAPRMYDMRSPMDPALSMAVANLSQTNHGVERPHLEDLLREAQKRSVSKMANERKNKVLLEGKVEHWARHMGVMTWVNLHMVLYAGTKELRIYTDSVQSAWGVVPIHEKGAIELRLLEKMECPTDAKWQGRRFDLICRSYNGEAKYPALGIKPGDENRVPHTIRYKFRAPTAQSRLLWVTLITAVLESPQMRMVKSPLANTYINVPGGASAADAMMTGTGMHTGLQMSRSAGGVLRLGGGGGGGDYHDDDDGSGGANDASFFGTTTTTNGAGGMLLTDTLASITTTSAYPDHTLSGSHSLPDNTNISPYSPSTTATTHMLNPGMSATSSAALMGATHANGHTGPAIGGSSVGGGGGGGGSMAKPPRKPGKLGLKEQALLMLGEGKARA